MEDDVDVYPYVAEGDVFAPAQMGYIVVWFCLCFCVSMLTCGDVWYLTI